MRRRFSFALSDTTLALSQSPRWFGKRNSRDKYPKDVHNRADQLYGKVDSHQLFIEAKKQEAAEKKALAGKAKEDSGSKKKKKKSAAESTHDEADPDETEGIGAGLMIWFWMRLII
jgi:hypothetical protein